MSTGPTLHKQPLQGRPPFMGGPRREGAGPIFFVLSALLVLAVIVGGAAFAFGAFERGEEPASDEVGRSADAFGSGPAVAVEKKEEREDERAPAKPSGSSASSARTVRGDVQIFEGGDETRGLKLTLPNPVVDGLKFPVLMDGATGKGLSGIGSGGGFIVKAHLMRGGRACPDGKVVHEGISTTNDELASMNVFVAGSFRWAQSGYAGDTGRQRVCGYLSRKDLGSGYDLVIDEPVDVKPNAGRTSYDDPPTPTGTYVAEAADIDGGTKNSAIAITLVAGDEEPRVQRAQVEGVRLSTCPTTEDNPLRGTAIDADLSIQGVEGLDNAFIGSTVSAQFKVFGSEHANAELVAGSDGHLLRGVVTVPSENGECRGSLAFTAQRSD